MAKIQFAPQTKKSDEVVAEILLRISEGETLTGVYASDKERYPHPTTWLDWVEQDPALALAYARARDSQADALAEGCLEVAHDATDDVEIAHRVDGVPYARINGHSVQRAKLIIETRLRLLSKWHHVKYGDKLLHAGHDGGAIKGELALSLPQLAERLREARKAHNAARDAIIDQPPAVALPAPAPVPSTPARRGTLEPGDPGMEFV